MNNDIVLEVKNLYKIYPGVTAINNVSWQLHRGEIHCLLGQNGAGKSTLVKMLSGIEQPDSGEIIFEGNIQVFKYPIDAQNAGIFTIHQELSLIPSLSVAENIFIDNLPRNKVGVINWKEMNLKAKEIISWLGFDINPEVPVSSLSMAYKQCVELCKALHHNAKVILLDEPTAALPAPDVKKFFKILKNLAGQGISLVFISHHLDEVLELCSAATVLRDGCNVGTYALEGMTEQFLVKAMIGSELNSSVMSAVLEGRAVRLGNGGSDEVVLSAKNVGNGGYVHDCSFDLKKGELLGITGLVGSGQNELAMMLFDGGKIKEGTVSLSGVSKKMKSPRDAVNNKLGFLPEERKTQGLVLALSILHNTSLSSLRALSKASVVNRRKENQIVLSYANKVKLKGLDNLKQPVSSLSGGNQQKVVFSKWLVSNCNILIFSEPTRGVDVGAKEEIYELIRQYIYDGGSVIMVTSEISEAIMCDRILVMSHGTIKGEIKHEDISSEESVLSLF